MKAEQDAKVAEQTLALQAKAKQDEIAAQNLAFEQKQKSEAHNMEMFWGALFLMIVIDIAIFIWIFVKQIDLHVGAVISAFDLAYLTMIGIISIFLAQASPPDDTAKTDVAQFRDQNAADTPTETPSLNGWTPSSDGYSWNSSTDEQKRNLCSSLAENSLRGNSANYFYDGLNAFYNSTSSSVLSVKLNDSCEMLEKGSSALPKSDTSY